MPFPIRFIEKALYHLLSMPFSIRFIEKALNHLLSMLFSPLQGISSIEKGIYFLFRCSICKNSPFSASEWQFESKFRCFAFRETLTSTSGLQSKIEFRCFAFGFRCSPSKNGSYILPQKATTHFTAFGKIITPHFYPCVFHSITRRVQFCNIFLSFYDNFLLYYLFSY